MADVPVKQQTTINRPVADVYAFWRDFSRLPTFMQHLERVELTDERHSHWVAWAPLGQSVEWDAEITDDQPNKLIAWRALPSSEIVNQGTVRFKPAPGERGTEVHVELSYDLPGGKLTALLAKITGEEPSIQVKEDLRRFKALLEAGEIPTITGQPHGTRSIIGKIIAAKSEAEQ